MTSRERIRAALNHRQPDRVPVDFGGTVCSGLSASVISRLRSALGLDCTARPVKVIEPFMMLGEIEDDLRDRMFVDTAGIFNTVNQFGFENSGWKEWRTFDGADVLVPGLFNTVPDDNGNIPMYAQGDRTYPPCAVMPKGGYYFDNIIRQIPLDDDRLDPADNAEDFGPFSEELLAVYERESLRLYNETEYAVVFNMSGAGFGDIMNVPGTGLKDPRGIRDEAEWYLSLAARRDYIHEVFDRQCGIALENLALAREALGDRVELAYVTGADFGTQRGPLISPDAYRDLFKPFHRRICDWIHEHTTWKVMMHTCGGVRPLLDDIIDAGFDVLNPVQSSAAGMDARELKDEYGGRIVFWGGGVNTQKTLPFGTPEDVYREVSERIRIFNTGGGFVFNAVHNIQTGTPVENLRAMLDAIEDSFNNE